MQTLTEINRWRSDYSATKKKEMVPFSSEVLLHVVDLDLYQAHTFHSELIKGLSIETKEETNMVHGIQASAVLQLAAVVLTPLIMFQACNAGSPAIRVASFNIRHFGVSLMSDESIAANIVKILQRYDLVFIMETRDSSEDSLRQLQGLLGPEEWDYVASEPIGRTVYYEEQYVYFYRPATVKFLDAQFYDDSASDVFEREPYIVQFQFWSQVKRSEAKVTFVGIHIDPDDVPAEMEGLVDVISSASTLYPDSGTIITMGDFNADCSYMSCSEREEATLFSTPEVFTSFIPHKTDTTVSHDTHCAYDRVVLSLGQGQPQVKVSGATVYDYEAGLGLSYDEANALSDHYPVEFLLE